MTTIVLAQPGVLECRPDIDPPDPGPGEALVRVHRVGVCGTDYHAVRGTQPFFSYPRILGHEVGVEVIAVGREVSNVRPGDRCAVEPYVDCGTCSACRRGRGNCCERIRVLGVHADGALRSHYIVPARKLHASTRLDYDQLALVETLGIGAHAVARAQVQAGESVLIVGAGPIGLAALQFVQAAGAHAVVMDGNAQRLSFVDRSFGVAQTLRTLQPAANAADTEAALRSTCGGDLPTVVIDATGNAAAMRAAFRYPAHGGRLVFVGLVRSELSFDDPDFHQRELTLFASRNSHADDFRRIIALIEAGRIDTLPWITHRAPIEAVPQRLMEWMDPASNCLKGVISVV